MRLKLYKDMWTVNLGESSEFILLNLSDIYEHKNISHINFRIWKSRRNFQPFEIMSVPSTHSAHTFHPIIYMADSVLSIFRYGSPHHNRSQSVKTPGRSSGRPNYLCLPQQRSRVASMPNTGVEEEYYRLRHFSITGKGIVNRGDSLKSRRSRSNNSVASSNSR